MKKNLLFIFAFLVGTCAFSQYEVTAFTSDYQPLESGETPIGVFDGWDDPEFAVPLGFDFTMGTTTFNTLVQVGFGSFLLGGSPNDGAVFGYLSDIIDGGQVSEGVPSEITYVTTGSPGSQICKIQFANVAFFTEVADFNTAENRTNFQIWYYEEDLTLEMRFGESNITMAPLVYEGANGPIIGIFTGVADDAETAEYGAALSGNPETPELELIDVEQGDIFSTALNATPADGQVYRFAPTIVSTDDLESEIQFSVFPNPTVDRVQIGGELPQNTPYRISDVTGKIVKSELYHSASTIDVMDLSPGIYLISLDGITTTQKFVKN